MIRYQIRGIEIESVPKDLRLEAYTYRQATKLMNEQRKQLDAILAAYRKTPEGRVSA